MFCSRKAAINAACGCAFQLRRPIDELLNRLPGFGSATLILRRPGLSVARSTHFGLHVRDRESRWRILRDAVSGLETDLGIPQNAYLLREFPDDCPLFAMGLPGEAIDCTVRLDGHRWDSPAIRRMLELSDAAPLDCLESRRLGAGAWLDEWDQAKRQPPAISTRLVHETARTLHHCRMLQVDIRTTTQRGVVRFQPSFVDSEGGVLRIADKALKHIVYADVTTDDFQLARDGVRDLQLSHLASR